MTGIYGGSFNPIHVGHVALSEALLSEGLVDELWLLVSPQNPLKRSDDLLPDDVRLRLARIATEGRPGLHVSDFEHTLPRPSYMAHTLRALQRAYPEREFALVIGQDNFECFDLWHEADYIRAHFPIIVLPRTTGSALPVRAADTGAAALPLINISSTEIRHAIRTDPAYDGRGLDPRVWDEIRRNHYYL